MRKILLVIGRGTVNGNTDRLAKAFIDRLYAISRNDRYPVKDTALLMTAGDDEANTFDIPIQYCDFIFGGKNLGHYCAGGCSGKPGHHSIPIWESNEIEQRMKGRWQRSTGLSLC